MSSNYEELEESMLENIGSGKNGSFDQFNEGQNEQTYDEVYDEGWDAFYNNFDRGDCQYHPNSREYGWWMDGFDDAEEQYFNNDYQY